MNLSAWLRTLLPTANDVAFFQEHGWYVAPKVLSDDIMDFALRGAERYWAGERDWPLWFNEGYKDWKPGNQDALRINEFVGLQSREIRALIEQPIIGAIAARLVGARRMRLWESELVYKPPNALRPKASVGWHTDRAYYMTCTSENLMAAWIPLHDCPQEMGPLMVVDGSHKWADLDHNHLREFLNTDLEGRGERLMGHRPGVRVIPIELSRGQISFHNAQLLHASDVNRSDRPRMNVTIHLQDGDNRYRPYLNDRGELWSIAPDRHVRKTPEGQPDYADPRLFPVLWDDEEQDGPARATAH